MLQDTSTADGAFSHAFKAYQLQAYSNDLFAHDQNHEKKHHLPWSIASVFQVSCNMIVTLGLSAPHCVQGCWNRDVSHVFFPKS